jgi:hypothetical protein
MTECFVFAFYLFEFCSQFIIITKYYIKYYDYYMYLNVYVVVKGKVKQND